MANEMRDLLVKLLDKTFEEQYKKCNIITAEHIADYLLANGVIVPPCNVGDIVWFIESIDWQQTKWSCDCGKVSMIQQKSNKTWKFRISTGNRLADYASERIGKTVFFSKEEAEKAVERMNKNG